MPIVEKWVEKDCICVIHQNDEIRSLICGYVGVDAEHPLYEVRYDQYTPVLEKSLKEAEKIRKREDLKALLKDRYYSDRWTYPFEAFAPTPENYFLNYPVNFSARGDEANLREFNCPAVWFFGFDSGHPQWMDDYHTEKDMISHVRRLCYEFAIELDGLKYQCTLDA